VEERDAYSDPISDFQLKAKEKRGGMGGGHPGMPGRMKEKAKRSGMGGARGGIPRTVRE
jgi:hypothetical protein